MRSIIAALRVSERHRGADKSRDIVAELSVGRAELLQVHGGADAHARAHHIQQRFFRAQLQLGMLAIG
jgi:hypothetical protein